MGDTGVPDGLNEWQILLRHTELSQTLIFVLFGVKGINFQNFSSFCLAYPKISLPLYRFASEGLPFEPASAMPWVS
jgi:hypothetical protein